MNMWIKVGLKIKNKFVVIATFALNNDIDPFDIK